MQIANVTVSLGGDHGNTVPKFAVTAAEIAVLRAIHGEDAVNDIEPIGDVDRSNRQERARLVFTYGGAKIPNTQTPIVENMFPGVAARVFETFDELDLDESFFKSTGRMKAPAPRAPLDLDPVGFLGEQHVDPEGNATGQPEPTDDADDGVGDDMPDANKFKDKPEDNILG